MRKRIGQAQRRPIVSAALLGHFDVGDDLRLHLRADAGQSGEFALTRGLLQFIDGRDARLFPQQFHALRSHIGHGQQLDHARRDGLLHPIEQIERAGVEQRRDLIGDGLPDTGDRTQFARLRDGVDVPIEIGDLLGGAAIGEDGKAILFAFDVEHIGQ